MLKVKCHDWSKSDFSADFKSVTIADEFVSKWMNKQGSSLRASTPQSRKRITTSSPILKNEASPSKRARFIKDEIDESTERKTKGMYLQVSFMSILPIAYN